MSNRPRITGRLIAGLIVLTLGVLWTLDNLGMMDASRIVRWWPVPALGWGLMRLTGVGAHRRPMIGVIWTLIGGVSLLHTLGVTRATFFDLWPLLLIAVGASLVFRTWRVSGLGTDMPGGATAESDSRISTFAFMAGAERKVVSQEFRIGDVSAVMGGATVDFRPAKLADGRAVVDVFTMWGGIDLIVPVGWRVVGEVTPMLGAFEDSTAPPTDPDAPTLVVRGLVLMGGVEARNDARRRVRYGERDPETGERSGVHVGPGGIMIGAIHGRRRKAGGGKEDYEVSVRVGKGGVEVRRGPRPAAEGEAPPAPPPVNPE